jgi:hypothetical protein
LPERGLIFASGRLLADRLILIGVVVEAVSLPACVRSGAKALALGPGRIRLVDRRRQLEPRD